MGWGHVADQSSKSCLHEVAVIVGVVGLNRHGIQSPASFWIRRGLGRHGVLARLRTWDDCGQ